MRLDRVFVDGFKNLKSVEIDFDDHVVGCCQAVVDDDQKGGSQQATFHFLGPFGFRGGTSTTSLCSPDNGMATPKGGRGTSALLMAEFPQRSTGSPTDRFGALTGTPVPKLPMLASRPGIPR